MLSRLVAGPARVSELAAPFAISLPGVWKHLRILERAGLIRTHKQGRIRRCRLEPFLLQDASRWLAQFQSLCEPPPRLLPDDSEPVA
jgi:DNA-binding transcriptional ArsR family regulator